MTALAELEAKMTDGQGYTTYVFKTLDKTTRKETEYIMCTRFPNWEHGVIDIGDVGFLEFLEIRAGKDKWFDGEKFVSYNKNMIQFIKFLKKKEKKDHKFVM